MSIKDKYDDEIDGQMDISDIMSDESARLVAVSRIFARARKAMDLPEQKTFVYALSMIRFTEESRSDDVYLDKKVLANIIGIHADADHLSHNLFRVIGELPKHSFIQITEEDRKLYASGCFITTVVMLKNRVQIKFNHDYIGLFTSLSKDYITMWSADIFRMQSRRAIQLYEYLRQYTDSRKQVNSIGLGVKAIKDMFGIPKDGPGSYMYKGHFRRSEFEKYVIDPVCDELSRTRMITLIVQPDGKYYVKEKNGHRVKGYRFYWAYTSHPRVASAIETKELQEKIDKNPLLEKVAKDIVDGEGEKTKKQKKTGKKDALGFNNNFNQRDYDFDKLERDLLLAQQSADKTEGE